MTTTLYATYDGEVLRLDHPVPLAPNTRVRRTIETEQPSPPAPASFIRTAQGLNLNGPAAGRLALFSAPGVVMSCARG